MKKWIILLGLAMLVATSAFAVTNPYDDIIGMYWDLNADETCIQPVSVPVNLYIILTNPTMETIGGFECGFSMDAGVAPNILSATFANPQSIDVVPGFQNFIVGFGAPTICTEATLLVTLSVGNFAGVEVWFYLHEATPASIAGVLPVLLLADGTLITVDFNGDPYYGTAFQGYEMWCIVGTENTSWDSVKAMYR